MNLFEAIYESAKANRLNEAKEFNTPTSVLDAIRSGYILRFLDGKKFLPEWLYTLVSKRYEELTEVDTTHLHTINVSLFKLLTRITGKNWAVNETIALLIRKSETFAIFDKITSDSIDTLVVFAQNAKSQWIKDLSIYKKIMEEPYNKELWHNFEKNVLEIKAERDAKKHNVSPDQAKQLYDTLYEDSHWGVYVPKSFEGDIELASHIEPFPSKVSNADDYDDLISDEYKNYNKARWCTAATKEYYDHYTNAGKNKLYVIKEFENGKYMDAWQIAFSLDRFDWMDKEDHMVEYRDLLRFPSNVLKVIVNDNGNLVKYSLADFRDIALKSLDNEALSKIKYDPEELNNALYKCTLMPDLSILSLYYKDAHAVTLGRIVEAYKAKGLLQYIDEEDIKLLNSDIYEFEGEELKGLFIYSDISAQYNKKIKDMGIPFYDICREIVNADDEILEYIKEYIKYVATDCINPKDMDYDTFEDIIHSPYLYALLSYTKYTQNKVFSCKGISFDKYMVVAARIGKINTGGGTEGYPDDFDNTFITYLQLLAKKQIVDITLNNNYLPPKKVREFISVLLENKDARILIGNEKCFLDFASRTGIDNLINAIRTNNLDPIVNVLKMLKQTA